MITNPPPYDSAPTLNATHASAPSPPVAAASSGTGAIPATPVARARHASSIAPQASSASTTHGPASTAAIPPMSAYANHRRPAPRARLAGTSDAPVRTATAATAAPAPR